MAVPFVVCQHPSDLQTGRQTEDSPQGKRATRTLGAGRPLNPPAAPVRREPWLTDADRTAETSTRAPYLRCGNEPQRGVGRG
jgi:hypothetical protein